MRPTLDEALEYVVDDELVEVRTSSFLPPPTPAAPAAPPISSCQSTRLLRKCLASRLWSFVCKLAALPFSNCTVTSLLAVCFGRLSSKELFDALTH